MTDATRTSLDDFLGAPAPSRWRKRAIWAGLIALLLLILFGLSRCFAGDAAPSYSTEEVRKGALTVSVSATGKLAPTNQVEVGSELSGLVEQVLVDVNDRVVKGQPIAVLDTSRLDDTITQSRATLAARQAAVEQARATLAEARASLNRFREVSRLSGGKVPARTEMESAIAADARARADVAAAQANVIQANAQLSSDETSRYKAVIRSPVNGVVLARQIDPGQTVAASFNTPTLFVIAEDLTAMKLEASIDEADVGQVKAGQRANFTVDAYPGRSFPATITRVNLGSDSSATTSSSSTSTASAAASTVVAYTAELAVSNTDQSLRPGMTATADILVEQKKGVLLVPNAALRFSPGAGAGRAQPNAIVGALTPRPAGRNRNRGQQERTIGAGSRQTIQLLQDDGTLKAIEVVTGSTDGRHTEVSGEGLRPGMKVVTGQKAAAE